jgi:hypothetical protein
VLAVGVVYQSSTTAVVADKSPGAKVAAICGFALVVVMFVFAWFTVSKETPKLHFFTYARFRSSRLRLLLPIGFWFPSRTRRRLGPLIAQVRQGFLWMACTPTLVACIVIIFAVSLTSGESCVVVTTLCGVLLMLSAILYVLSRSSRVPLMGLAQATSYILQAVFLWIQSALAWNSFELTLSDPSNAWNIATQQRHIFFALNAIIAVRGLHTIVHAVCEQFCCHDQRDIQSWSLLRIDVFQSAPAAAEVLLPKQMVESDDDELVLRSPRIVPLEVSEHDL